MIQNLRILELAAGIALATSPEKAEKLLGPLGVKLATARNTAGLKTLIS